MTSHSRTPADWTALPPEDLLSRPALVAEAISPAEAGKALAYSRQSTDASYDERAHRLMAATPCRGEVPLQSIARMRQQHERDREPSRIRRVRREHDALRPRALDLPVDEGRIRYEFKDDTLEFFVDRPSGRGPRDEDHWIVGRSHPPGLMQRDAVPRDAPQTINQRYTVQLSQAAWVPLTLLIDTGRFLPRQAWEDRLLRRVEAGRLYLFVSHRWRSPEHPDREGRESALLAWQLVDHLVEAVLIASRRGLQSPRLYARAFGMPIGLAGRELSESLIVNVLRPRLSAPALDAAALEAAALESVLATGVLQVAQADTGLAQLRRLLEGSPVLQQLAEGISLWYDYASLPQAPRTAAEQQVFDAGLHELSPMQMMGMTVVLIDRPERYLARAWCTLEAIGANVSNQDLVLLHAELPSAAGAPDDNEIGAYFIAALNDRPHIVRRAVLDTMLFGIQTPAQCFERLQIGLSQASDLDAVFGLLRQVSATPGVHADNGSIVTGCWPLPTDTRGSIVLPVRSPPLETLQDRDGTPGSLDWTHATLLLDSTPRPVVPAHQVFAVAAGTRRAHVVVMGGCEGDAILVAGWAVQHRAALEAAVGAAVASIGWTSDDIAAVGHLACGRLEPTCVTADLWVFIAPITRLEHAHPARALMACAAAAGRERIVVVIDQADNNVMRLAPFGRSADATPPQVQAPEALDLTPIEGGIFSAALGADGPPLFLRQSPRAEDAVEDAGAEVSPEDLGPAPPELQVALINAVFRDDDRLVEQICEAFPRSIDEQFRAWMQVPQPLRDSPQQMQAYVQALFRVAQQMKSMGFGGPLRTLTAADDNPITRWHDQVQAAQEAASRGDRAAAIGLLQQTLDDMQGASGPAVDELRPKLLGMLCGHHFEDGRLAEARDAAERALGACEAASDEQGISIYRQNLQLIAAAAAEGDPLVAQIARAQALSDQGRYENSNAVLDRLVPDGVSLPACKLHGLHALNDHWRGDHAAAAQHAREAVRLAQAIGDPDALRVYRYNLERIEAAAGG